MKLIPTLWEGLQPRTRLPRLSGLKPLPQETA